MDVVLEEFSVVGRAVGPQELTMAMLFPVLVLPLVAGVVRPDFLPLSVLLVLEPEPFIPRPVRVMVVPEAVGFIIFPFTVVHVAVRVNKPSAPIGLVSTPITFVERSIDPNLDASAVFSSHFVPFTLVFRPVVQGEHRPLDSYHAIGRRAWLEIERFEGVSDLHDQFTGLKLLLVGLGVGGHGECGVFRLEAVLGLDGSARHQATEISLHGQHGLVLTFLGVKVRSLSSRILCFLSIKLRFIKL